MHIILRRGTGRDAIKGNGLERRQHAAVERGSEGGAPSEWGVSRSACVRLYSLTTQSSRADLESDKLKGASLTQYKIDK